MSGHTPGPWIVASRIGDDWESVVCIPNSPNEICQCFHDPDNTDECTANSRLIAAAPELLEALKSFVEMVDNDQLISRRKDHEALMVLLTESNAAIAKAEGKQ